MMISALIDTSAEQAPLAPSPLLEIANVMVRLYKDAFGRGPSKARAQFSGSDTLVVLLEDMMTVAERQLVALGEHSRAREHRLFLQLALEDAKRSEVERILGRGVLACVSGTDPGRDLAAEVFVLEPASLDAWGTSRTHHDPRRSPPLGRSGRARSSP
jgi:uncharacterized protein YbcI